MFKSLLSFNFFKPGFHIIVTIVWIAVNDSSDLSDPSDRRWDRWRKRSHIIARVAQIVTKSQLLAPAGQLNVFFWRVKWKKIQARWQPSTRGCCWRLICIWYSCLFGDDYSGSIEEDIDSGFVKFIVQDKLMVHTTH